MRRVLHKDTCCVWRLKDEPSLRHWSQRKVALNERGRMPLDAGAEGHIEANFGTYRPSSGREESTLQRVR